MSILYQSPKGYFISHEAFINKMYCETIIGTSKTSFKYKTNIFNIKEPFKNSVENQISKKRKRKHSHVIGQEDTFVDFKLLVRQVEENYKAFRRELHNLKVLREPNLNLINTSQALLESPKSVQLKTNSEALYLAEMIYNISKQTKISDAFGANNSQQSITTQINGETFLFPSNCRFFCKDVSDIQRHLHANNSETQFTKSETQFTNISEVQPTTEYDLILMDPPWWNKYIRRKNSKCDNAYKMMYNEDLKNIPVESLLKKDGIVAVWCTNSQQHMKSLIEDIFPKWKVKYLGKWFWVKVTKNGEPTCNFSEPPGKQPFEQIVFGCRIEGGSKEFSDGKLVVSVPSALHSHKPPLVDLLSPFLPKDADCLEIFARYLLPNWTSYGLEALLLQHESLFEEVEEKS